MKRSELVAALLILGALTLTGIFDHELWTPDEPRDAEIAREMLERGSWTAPTLNLRPHLEKPPLYFWSVALAYKSFGVHAWSARLPSVLFAWGSLLFTFLIARRMFGAQAAWSACLVLATMAVFLDLTHKCAVDNALLFFSTGTFYWLYAAFQADHKVWRYLAAYGFALAAFLSKGVVGVGLTGGAFLVFLLWAGRPREILRAHPWFAFLIVGGGAAAWLAALTPEMRDAFLIDNQMGRFTGQNALTGHIQPFYYYAVAASYAFAPWILALVPALPWAIRRDEGVLSKRFLLAWIFVNLALLSLASTKREIYLLPLAPAVAILVAAWFEQVPARPKWATALLAIFAASLLVGHVAVWGAAVYLRSWGGLAISVGLAAAALYRLRGGAWQRTLTTGAASLIVGGVFVLFPYVDQIKDLAPFCRTLPAIDPVPAYLPDETTLAVVPFYTGRYVREIKNEAEARDAAAHKPAYILVLRKRGSQAAMEALKKWYPYVASASGGSRGGRVMVLLANAPKGM